VPRYRFDIEANTKKAKQNIKELNSLLERLNKVSNSSGKIDTSKNSGSIRNMLGDYQRLSKTYEDLSKSAQRYSQSPDFKGKTEDFQQLDSILSKASNTLNNLAREFNTFGSSNSSGLGKSVKDAQNLKTELNENEKIIRQIRRDEARTRRLGNQQDKIANRASSTGYMSFRDLGTYLRNQKEIEKLNQFRTRNNGTLYDVQEHYNNLKQQNSSGIGEDGKPLTMEQHVQNAEDMRSDKKLIGTIRRANTTISSTEETASASDSLLKATPLALGAKANFALLALDIGKKAIEFVKNDVKAGNKVNQSTGEQALNIGNVSGHASDDEIRGRVQKLMRLNGLGYTTQEGLDYYALAERSRSYKQNNFRSTLGSFAMTNALEVGGRATGISNNSWQNVASAAMNSGGILSDRDVYRLSSTIAGENMRSGNSGDAEGNAKILTSAIQQLSRSGGVNETGIGNLAATTALLSRSSKLFSGEQGEQRISSINQGFENAGSGKDQALLYMMIQSNPAKYGGPAGMVRAQKVLNGGLSDPENIKMTQNVVRRMGQAGEQGRAMGTLFLETHFGLDAKSADKLSKDMVSGKYTTGQIKSEAKKLDKAGTRQRRQNIQSYLHSDQASYNQENAQREARQSKSGGAFKWFRDMKNGIGNFFSNTFSSIGNFFGGSTVHADTLTKKQQRADRANHRLTTHSSHSKAKKTTRAKTTNTKLSTRAKARRTKSVTRAEVVATAQARNKKVMRGSLLVNKGKASSSATIAEKRQAASRTTSYLNTRNEEKNLRNERDNIDRRNASLKEFAKLLKEEKNGIHGGGKAGTAGTVGLKDKKDKKSKKGQSSKNSSKHTSKSSSSSSAKKSAKKLPAKANKRSLLSSRSLLTKSVINNNNINISVPSGAGKPDNIADWEKVGNLVAQKVKENSRDYNRGD
jgi:hypothetical protein